MDLMGSSHSPPGSCMELLCVAAWLFIVFALFVADTDAAGAVAVDIEAGSAFEDAVGCMVMMFGSSSAYLP